MASVDKKVVQVEVWRLDGTIVKFPAEESWTVAKVKESCPGDFGAHQLLFDGRILQEDETLQGLAKDGLLRLDSVSEYTLQPQDIKLSQTIKETGGCDDYLIGVTHVPTGQTLEHKYCSYSSMYGGPIIPDKVTNLQADVDGDTVIVKWEWSENSFDLASHGVYCKRPLAWMQGKMEWAAECRKTKRPKPEEPLPDPPEVVLSSEEEVKVDEVRISVGQHAHNYADYIAVLHTPSGSEVQHDRMDEDTKGFVDLELTQAGGFVRVQFRERWVSKYSGGVKNHCRFVKLTDGRLAWA